MGFTVSTASDSERKSTLMIEFQWATFWVISLFEISHLDVDFFYYFMYHIVYRVIQVTPQINAFFNRFFKLKFVLSFKIIAFYKVGHF